jgi:hypothetical protein
LAAWALGESQSGDGQSQIEEGLDAYEITFLTKHLSKLPCLKYLPVFPTFTSDNCKCRKTQATEEVDKQNSHKIA